MVMMMPLGGSGAAPMQLPHGFTPVRRLASPNLRDAFASPMRMHDHPGQLNGGVSPFTTMKGAYQMLSRGGSRTVEALRYGTVEA